MIKRLTLLLIALLALLPAAARAEAIFGLTSGGAIFSFDSANPNTINGLVLVGGLAMGDSLVDIDFYPTNGQLYGFAQSGNLYRINTTTGIATLAVTPQSSVGMVLHSDFNPAADRARIISAGNTNFRLTPDVQTPGPANNGLVTNDGNFMFAAGSGMGTPNLFGAAYTNNFDGTATTALYTIDATNLYINSTAMGAPAGSFGTLTLVGGLGFTLGGFNGFDISQSSGLAFLSDGDSLFMVNLATGATTALGDIGGLLGADTISIATVAVPEPSTAILLVAGLIGAGVVFARRKVRA